MAEHSDGNYQIALTVPVTSLHLQTKRLHVFWPEHERQVLGVRDLVHHRCDDFTTLLTNKTVNGLSRSSPLTAVIVNCLHFITSYMFCNMHFTCGHCDNDEGCWISIAHQIKSLSRPVRVDVMQVFLERVVSSHEDCVHRDQTNLFVHSSVTYTWCRHRRYMAYTQDVHFFQSHKQFKIIPVIRLVGAIYEHTRLIHHFHNNYGWNTS